VKLTGLPIVNQTVETMKEEEINISIYIKHMEISM